MSKMEKKFLDFIGENAFYIGLIALFAISIILRLLFINFKSGDWAGFLIKWSAAIRNGGGIAALKENIGNYNFLYLICLAIILYIPIPEIVATKLLSIIFDYIAAFAAMQLVYTLVKKNGGQEKSAQFRGKMVLFLVMFSPAVIMNSALWAQCDVIYTSFVLFCMDSLIKEKYRRAFILFGIALSFKLQAIFLLPAIVILYVVKKKFSIVNFLWVPAMFELTSLPVIIMRLPKEGIKALLAPFLVYANQTGYYDNLSLRMPNVPYLLRYGNFQSSIDGQKYSVYFKAPFILFTLAILGMAVVLILVKKWNLNTKGTMLIGIWSMYTCIMFLPSMHERYGFGLSLLFLCFTVANREYIRAFILYSIIEVLSYLEFIFNYFLLNLNNFMYIIAMGNILLYIYMTIQMVQYLEANGNQSDSLPASTGTAG